MSPPLSWTHTANVEVGEMQRVHYWMISCSKMIFLCFLLSEKENPTMGIHLICNSTFCYLDYANHVHVFEHRTPVSQITLQGSQGHLLGEGNNKTEPGFYMFTGIQLKSD